MSDIPLHIYNYVYMYNSIRVLSRIYIQCHVTSYDGLVDLPNDMKENSNGCLQLMHWFPVLVMMRLVLEQRAEAHELRKTLFFWPRLSAAPLVLSAHAHKRTRRFTRRPFPISDSAYTQFLKGRLYGGREGHSESG